MSDPLDLEQLRNQAKHLLRAFRARDASARLRVAAHLPRFVAPSSAASHRELVLADALCVIAREHGFVSWPRLKAFATTTSAVPTATTAASGGAARRIAISELAARLANLATHHDVAGLAGEFSRMPRRDILAVRAVLMEREQHAVLVDALLAGVHDPRAWVRYDCAHALDHFADDRCVESLRRLLDDPVPRVRRVALHVLSCATCKLAPLPTGDDLVLRVIGHALSDPSINVQRHATAALGMCRDDPRARHALGVLSASDHDPAIQRYVQQALRHYREQTG